MSEEVTNQLPESKSLNDIYMQSKIVDQFNTNQQSNMTLSASSFITQSFSAVKMNIVQGSEEVEDEV